jgi:uncharacterized protein
MRRTILATALCVALSATAAAEPFADGATAFQRGDHAAAAAAWRPLAERGDARAAFNMGILADRGLGAPADRAEAVRWYRSAAERGDARAAFNLAEILTAGDGVPREPAEAARWYEKAAEKNHTQAQVALSVIYANGTGVDRDLAKAAEWAEKANESNMQGESNTSCTTQRSAERLEACRRAVPKM